MKTEKKKYYYPQWAKQKTIKIDNDLHDKIKEYCDTNGINIYSFTEQALKLHLSNKR
jgi:hypothetical protein